MAYSMILVRVSAEVVHRRGIEAASDPGERGPGHVDFSTVGGFVRTARAVDGAVDDVHAGLPRDDADPARADAGIADVKIAALFGNDRVTRELDGSAVDAHEAIALADDRIGAPFDVAGNLLGLGRRRTFGGFLPFDGITRAFESRRLGRRRRRVATG